MNSNPRLIHFAPIYRSFPLDWIRQRAAGATVAVIGSAIEALRMSLADSVIEAIPWGGARDRREAMAGVISARQRVDWTIITEPDFTEYALDEPDLLFALRQSTRKALILPFRVDSIVALSTSAFQGMAQPEGDGDKRWRWIQSNDGVARFVIWAPPGLETVSLVFTAIFCDPLVERGITTATLTVSDGTSVDEKPISVNSRLAVDVRIVAGKASVEIRTDLPCLSAASDPRTLSMGIFQPELRSNDRTLLSAEAFLAGRGGAPLTIMRKTLHLFGFEYVGGLACGMGYLPSRADIPSSHGNPHRTMGDDADPLSDQAEIALSSKDVAWLACGTRFDG